MITARHRLLLLGVGLGLSIVAVGALAVVLLPHRNAPGLEMQTRLRIVLSGMMAYAQNNRDAFPPPDQTIAALTGSGAVPASVFQLPPSSTEPLFLAITSSPTSGRWGNSFSAAEPLLMINPALSQGRETSVAFTDGHVDRVSGAALQRLQADFAGRIAPIR